MAKTVYTLYAYNYAVSSLRVYISATNYQTFLIITFLFPGESP